MSIICSLFPFVFLSEGNYAHELKVPIVPLVLQPKYKPDDWLGLVMAGKKWVDLSSDDYKRRFSDVLDEVRHVLKGAAAPDVIQAAHQTIVADPTVKGRLFAANK